MNTVYGIHSVEETLKSRPKGVHYVAMARERKDTKLQRSSRSAAPHGIQVRLSRRKSWSAWRKLARTKAWSRSRRRSNI